MDDLITSQQLAERLAVPIRTLEHWRLVGRGPTYVHVGRRVRYRTSDVETWLRANTTATPV